ncbi:MAG TPA: DUF5060 domain-containing protein [Armatimonadota bacterium]|mgnify:FL=1|nr:DUF5060 domain-containing protein [Armatimonadota bacterium]
MSNAYRVLLVFLFLAVIIAAEAADVVLQPSINDNRPLWISKINLSRQVVPRYEKLELTFDLKGTYRNAFDPAEIDVNGIFVGPDNKTITVPAFLYRNYTRELRGNREYLTPKGSTEWKIRFAPTQIGKYSVTVSARDRTGKTVRSDKYIFECEESNNPGFVRKSRVDHRYFAFDNGKSYVPVGINVAWATSRGTYDYDDWFTQLGKAGCNYARVWITPGIITLASEKLGEPQDRYGIGKFDLASSWKLDYVVDLASRNGLYLMICTDSFNTLRMKKDGNHPFWEETPYNKTNNGPLEKPEDFWTNEAARSLYKNKLRYLVARYGWSTNVMCWEFWNEVDCVSPQVYNVDLITKWHIEMSDYLRNIDPWKHLHATSIGNSNGEKQFDQLPQMDFVQTHNYTTHDFTALFTEIQKKKEYYKKPHFISEFG